MPQAAPWRWALVPLIAMLAVLSGCGTAPRSSGAGAIGALPRPAAASNSDRDGPEAHPPDNLASVPDAEPQIEPIRKGGPNKPYEALGHDYVPIADDRPYTERGLASWYGRKFNGRPTASGEPYNMYAMTAAHPTLPIPSYARVRNPANDREVVVRINDRGPFHSGRIIDLSYTAAYKLGLLKGVAPVEVTRITFDEIRTGSWRKQAVPDAGERNATMLASGKPGPVAAANAATKAGGMQSSAPSAGNALTSASSSSPDTRANAEPPANTTNPAASADDPIASVAAASAATPMPSASSPSSTATAATADAASKRPSAGFWVQLGVFRQREGADGFHRRIAADVDWLAPLLAVFGEPNGYRLQAGPYASRDEAQGVARRVREALNLVPVIVERR